MRHVLTAPARTGAAAILALALSCAAAAPARAQSAPTNAAWSADAGRVVAWVRQSRDNGKLPFIVIDKPSASLLLFAANGKVLGETPVLLGTGIGDTATPGVGSRKLAEIGPAERTTPAGRFVARYGRAIGQQQVLWVDWNTSVALHPVITTNRRERRLERLLSPDPADNRISFGCINVPTKFYRESIRPLLRRTGGVVYVLPDIAPLEDVFPRLRLQRFEPAAGQPPGTDGTADERAVRPLPQPGGPATPQAGSAPRRR